MTVTEIVIIGAGATLGPVVLFCVVAAIQWLAAWRPGLRRT